MKKLRSVLSIVLVIAMVLSLLPHSVPRTHAEGQAVDVTIEKYGYEMIGGEKKKTVPNLPGAYLQVQDSKGNKVYPTDAEFFISGDSAKKIKLPPGQYQLVELSAPDGYIGTSQPVPFTVKEATTILDTQTTYTSQWIPPNNQTEIRGVGGNVIYYNGKYHPASCIQADKRDPESSGTPSRYVPEGDYTAFEPKLKEQIKRVIYKYQFDNAEAYRILGSSNYPKANLYWVVARVIEDLTLQPGKTKVHDYKVFNNNSEGKLLDVYKYFMDVAMDATIVTFGWQLLFFETDEAHQDLVVVELEKNEPVEVSLGNEKGSTTPTPDSITLPVELAITSSKTLNGSTLTAGQFTFQLTDGLGNILQTATNDAQGKISFNKLSFNQPGNFTYKIKEVKGDDSSITYDESIKTFTVSVEKQGSSLVITKVSGDVTVTSQGNAAAPVPGQSGIGTSYPGSYSFVNIGDSQTYTLTINGTVWNAFCLDHFRDDARGATYRLSSTLDQAYGAATAEKIKGILYYGYPMDGSGEIMQAIYNMGYTGEKAKAFFSYATNYAIWKATETIVDASGDFKSEVVKIGKMILDKGKAPSHLNISGYVYTSGNLQPLLIYTIAGANSITGIAAGSFVNNYYKPETVEVKGVKTWEDNQDALRVRPSSITVRLLADGQVVDSKKVTEDDGWVYNFGQLAKHNAQGKEIKYTVEEDAVPGYSTVVNGLNIINYLQPVEEMPRFTEDTIPAELVLNLSKALEGADINSNAYRNAFEFVIEGSNGAPMPSVTRVRNNGAAINFGKIWFDKAGTFTYTVKEVAGSESGMSYSTAAKSFTVKVVAKVLGPKTCYVISDISSNTDNVTPSYSYAGDFPAVNMPSSGKGSHYPVTSGEYGNFFAFQGDGKTYVAFCLDRNHGLPNKNLNYTLTTSEWDVNSNKALLEKIGYFGYPYDGSGEMLKYAAKMNQQYLSYSGPRISDEKLFQYATNYAVWKILGSSMSNDITVPYGKAVVYTADKIIETAQKNQLPDNVQVTMSVYKPSNNSYQRLVAFDVVTKPHAASLSFTDSFVNVKEEKTEVSGEKIWVDGNNQDGKRPESITINLLANGEKVDSRVVTAANNWRYSFTNLPKKANGRDIEYTITEEAVSGYTTEVNGYDVTNTHTPEKTEVSGKKIWVDGNNQDGTRPESITINLFANGESVDSQVVTAADNWSFSFTDLDKYANGRAIVYTITENEVTGYSTEVNGFKVTNTYIPETVEVSGIKTWNDAENQDGKRPSSISVKLLADGDVVETKTVTAANNWSYSFTNLPKYRDGIEIEYTVAEDVVEGYSIQINGYDITNTYTPGETEISGIKTWNDAENQDGKRPASITIRLHADGKEIASKTVSAKDNWSYKFEKLPLMSNGKAIQYTISEDEVTAYTTVINGYNVTNTYTPETTKVEGSKTWNDADNQDGKRPESITIKLLADGVVVDTKTVKEADGWKYSFTNLPKYKEGKEIKYTITEEKVTDYTTVINGYDVTNSYTPDITEVSGTKTWNDKDNQDGKRPTSIVVRLYANGTEIAYQTVTVATNWTYKFENLPKMANGQVIEYTVSEDEVTGYTTEINGYDIINKYTPETTKISGSKTWKDAGNQDGKRPESITINLLANGRPIKSVTVTAEDDWKYSFTGLDKYQDGDEITYSITEDPVTGYTTEINGYDVTNSAKPATTEVSGSKTWNDGNNQDGKRPESITVNLMADGVKVDSVTVTEADGWSYSFTNLPKFKDGTEIEYTVTEDTVDGYSTRIDGYNITNTYTPGETEISGIKTWNDGDNQDGKRPESITINLLADGKKIASKTVTEKDKWSYKFENLPKMANGKEIVYTISEDPVTAYTTVINGYNVTNTYTPETTKVEGSKTWNDANNQDGKRPESITINLLADGVVVDTKTVKEADGWKYSFTNLPKYKEGKEIKYTITEEKVTDYTTVINGYDVTNSYTPDITEVSGTKTWNDKDNQDGKRPTAIVIRLYANGEQIDSQTVTVATNWKYTFANLPKMANGKEIVYTISEDEVPGYTTDIDGFDVTNSYSPETTEVEGSKTWVDDGDQDSKRPASITINLLANGRKVASKTVTAKDGWKYSFTGLDKYRDGNEITYTVTEEPVNGYATEIDGYDVINTKQDIKTKASDQADGDKYLENQGSVTVKDVVEYTSLIPGREYTMEGQLVKKSDGSVITTARTSFTASETGFGKVELLFIFPADALRGEALVAFETCKYGEEEVAVHADINDEDQTVYVPEIGTTATDSVTKDHIAGTEEAVTINDVVAYKGLIPGKEYTMEGQLRLKSSGEAIGAAVTKTFTANGSGKGTVTLSFTLTAEEAAALRGDSVVAFETAKEDGKAVAVHADIHDEEQTVHFPEVKTNATDKADGDKTLEAMESVTIVDTVTYTNLIPGKTYTVSGTLMDKATGEACTFPGATASKTFVADKANGSVELEFTFDASNLQRKVLVVFESLSYNGKVVATHQDLTDVAQTVEVEGPIVDIYVNKVWKGDDESSRPASITVKLLADGKDTGKTLVLSAKNNWTGAFKDLEAKQNGKEIAYTVEEVAVAGYISTISGNGGRNVTITNSKPEIKTQASDQKDDDKYLENQGSVTVKDVVEYKGLIPGKEYTMEGQLVKKSDASVVTTATAKFTASESGAGKVELFFTFPADALKGEALVAFETCKYGENEIAVHADINDEDQTVYVPEIGTTATDSVTKDHIANADSAVTIIDVVAYKGLIPGKEYTMEGQLHVKSSGKAIGRQVTQTFVAGEKGSGSVTIEFTLTAGEALALKGDSVVAFETALDAGKEVAVHADINDEDQTVRFPEAKTNATDKADGDKTLDSLDKVTVVDKVTYTNLIPGKTYTVSGTLMDKATGEACTFEGATASKTFVAKTANGSVNLEFTFDASALQRKVLVVFETVSYDGNVVATHQDLNDKEQTVDVEGPTTEINVTKRWLGDDINSRPAYITVKLFADGVDTGKTLTLSLVNNWSASFKGLDAKLNGKDIVYTVEEVAVAGYETSIEGNGTLNVIITNGKAGIETQATDQKDGDKYLESQGSVTVKDVVEYKGLIPGKEYSMEGQLVKKSDTSVVATASKTFTASASGAGKVELLFTFPADSLKGEALVAFETCKKGDEEVAVHADINDEDQTVYVPEIGTTATDSVTKDHIANASEAVTIIDVVEYKALIPGGSYTMEGQLHLKSNGEAFGKKVVQPFTASETGSGSVTIEFVLSAEEAATLKGQSVVAFETARENGQEVATHADINDENQTVHFPEAKTNAVDKADGDQTLAPEKQVTVVDKVTYTNLIPGKTYTVSGTLMDKGTGQACTFEGATASKTFVAETADGSVELEFTFDASALQRQVLVVFETVTYNGNVVATHQDLTDADQTVEVESPVVDIYVNKVWKGDDITTRPAYITVKLIANGTDTGKTLVLSLANNWTGSFTELQAKQDGQDVVYTVEEVEVSGYISSISGNGTRNITITNAKPSIETEASDQADGDKYLETQGTVTVKDVVEYKDLIPGREYTMEGQLVRKSDGGLVTTANRTFTASESGNGKVELFFTFPVDSLKGEALVAFETCKFGEEEVAVHADINDEDQTVYVPEIGTTATDSETGGHMANASEAVTIIDVVEYKALIPGAVYTMEGQLHLKSDADKTIGETVTKTFTADESGNGSVVMEFTLTAEEAAALKGESVVAFETVKENGKEIAVHADINDEDQTVHFPEAKTNATDKTDGDKIVRPVEMVTIVDEVSYRNLQVGKEYTISGTLHIKNADGSDGGVLVIDGQEVTASKTFTASQANGSETLEFTLNATALNGRKVVAFEKVLQEGKVVATHEDIMDVAQTVEVKGINVSVKKTWIGEAPNFLRLQLKRDGAAIELVTLSAYTNWSYEWKGLPADHEYEVVEVVPAGYVQTGMKVNKDAEGNYLVELENTGHPEVKINKTDMGGTEVDGAEIMVIGEDLELTWISKIGETMSFVAAPGEYTLIELNAPEGYQQVTTDIEFRVELDGTVTVLTTLVEPAGAVEVRDGVLILKDEIEELATIPPVTEEETTKVNAETAVPTTAAEEEEESTTVQDTTATIPSTEEEETTREDAETVTPAHTTSPTVPDTGDHSNIMLYVAMLGAAASGTSLLLARRKKEEE